MRIYLPMRIDADIRIIRHMSDIARYMRLIFWIGMASAWPSVIHICQQLQNIKTEKETNNLRPFLGEASSVELFLVFFQD